MRPEPGNHPPLDFPGYFPDEAALNGADPVLATVPAERRSTLIAVPLADGLLEFDIRVQGDRETVFFDL